MHKTVLTEKITNTLFKRQHFLKHCVVTDLYAAPMPHWSIQQFDSPTPAPKVTFIYTPLHAEEARLIPKDHLIHFKYSLCKFDC